LSWRLISFQIGVLGGTMRRRRKKQGFYRVRSVLPDGDAASRRPCHQEVFQCQNSRKATTRKKNDGRQTMEGERTIARRPLDPVKTIPG
jgi:hypothetical protein